MQGARKGGEGVLANEDPPPQPCANVPALMRPHQQPWTRRGSWVLVRGTLNVPIGTVLQSVHVSLWCLFVVVLCCR